LPVILQNISSAFGYLHLVFTIGEYASILECGIRLWLVLHGSCTEVNFVGRHPIFGAKIMQKQEKAKSSPIVVSHLSPYIIQ